MQSRHGDLFERAAGGRRVSRAKLVCPCVGGAFSCACLLACVHLFWLGAAEVSPQARRKSAAATGGDAPLPPPPSVVAPACAGACCAGEIGSDSGGGRALWRCWW